MKICVWISKPFAVDIEAATLREGVDKVLAEHADHSVLSVHELEENGGNYEPVGWCIACGDQVFDFDEVVEEEDGPLCMKCHAEESEDDDAT